MGRNASRKNGQHLCTLLVGLLSSHSSGKEIRTPLQKTKGNMPFCDGLNRHISSFEFMHQTLILVWIGLECVHRAVVFSFVLVLEMYNWSWWVCQSPTKTLKAKKSLNAPLLLKNKIYRLNLLGILKLVHKDSLLIQENCFRIWMRAFFMLPNWCRGHSCNMCMCEI